MPYIGRNHIAGDHTSNFKVLDDISSYTATFNGSLATIISTADETIRIPEHRFIQGQRVTYSNGGGGNIGGLTNGTAYFVTFDTANTIKLATSLANANSNTNINLSSVGSGSSHTLTAAFDGVNTTFKITHGGGSSADIVNSAQLQIAINNVIQKANLDSSYTEGFLVVDSRKIQFKTAPTADDIFWGNIIANTIDTFDIADLKIDQFTGDGVTTQFTLSRDVPNNQSVMVTLDGVVQHPSDKDTTRAYRILAEKVIEFSSPPGLNIEIQVRHLGFAGASTGDVTGFYGRTGNVVLGASDHITTGDITSRNVNASGIVTASSFVGNLTGNVSGNLTVGGVLTYEDVTNVDSIGIITARSDIHVGAGVSVVGIITASTIKSTNLSSGRVVFTTSGGQLEGSGNLTYDGTTLASGSPVDINSDLDVDGHTNLDNVSVAGVSTFANKVTAAFGSNKGIQVGSNLRLTDQANVFIQNTANSTMYLMSKGTQIRDRSNNNLASFSETGGSGLFHHSGSSIKLVTTATGINLPEDLDVDGHTNLDNVSIAGVTTMSGNLTISNTAPVLKLVDTDNNSDFSIYGAAGVFNIYDETNSASRLTIASDGTITAIQGLVCSSTLTIPDSIIHSGDTNTKIRFPEADAVTIETNGSERFRINSSGAWGIGAAYGSSGQVLTSGGSGSSPSWTTITGTTINNNADNRIITGSGTANTLNGESTLTYDGSGTLEISDNGSSYTLTGPGVTKHEIGASASDNDLVIQNNKGAGNITSNIIFKGSGAGGATVSEKMRITTYGVGINHNTSGAASNAALTISNRTSSSATRFNLVNSGSSQTESTQIYSQNNDLVFVAGASDRLRIDSNGHTLPGADNTQDLGSSSKRWRDIYTGDLNLSNKGRTNDVDNSWGDWTLQEGESDVFMINNRSGKKFKIKMEEVN